jgi:integrase/recombinase XerD
MKKTKIYSPEFNKIMAGFIYELKKEGKDQIYIDGNTNRMMEFLSYIENIGITAIKHIDQTTANRYMKYMEEERVNENFGGTLWQTTINLHINAISKFWKYLAIEGIEANTIFIKHRKKTTQKEITVLTHEEMQQLYFVCDSTGLGYRDKATLAIYYGCGMRNGEGMRLLITDIDFNRGRIHVRKSKNGSERYVMMSPKVRQQIEDYVYCYRDLYVEKLSGQTNPDTFFIGEGGRLLTKKALLSRLQKLWKKVKGAYGNDKHIGVHTLRHTLGTHLYMAKMDIEMIALMLGHRSLCTTQVYIHLTNLLQNEKI